MNGKEAYKHLLKGGYIRLKEWKNFDFLWMDDEGVIRDFYCIDGWTINPFCKNYEAYIPEIALKHCPLCGAPVRLAGHREDEATKDGRHLYTIHCQNHYTNCALFFGPFDSLEETVEKWNHRAKKTRRIVK